MGAILSTIGDAAHSIGTVLLIPATVTAWLYAFSGARRG